MAKAKWLGWHFLPDDKRLRHGDGRIVQVGETYKVAGNIEACSRGLHASKRAIDALNFAPGAMLCRVELRGTIVEESDKAAASERHVIAMADATKTLHEFACWCAERALKSANVEDVRLWQAIEMKRKWLNGEATDAELDAARSAAWSARSAAWSAESAARSAESAAWSAESAAESAAKLAAWSARSAAWSAWLAAAWSARSAAWSAESAARSAESAAWSARSAAWSAESAQNDKLEADFAKLLGIKLPRKRKPATAQ